MKGLLKSKSAGNQFLLLISIALVSFFLLGLVGTMILSAITGINVTELSDSSKWDFSKPGIINFIRGYAGSTIYCIIPRAFAGMCKID